jgi:hypothetical protein
MAFNAYLVFPNNTDIKGESTSEIPEKGDAKPIEIADSGFGVSMPVTTSRSDGGGATVGRANFDVFTCNKASTRPPANSSSTAARHGDPKILLHLYRQGEGSDATGVVKYAMVVFQHCVITKVGITGGGEELPKEALEFNYGVCEYVYQETDHETGKPKGGEQKRAGWSTISNKFMSTGHDFKAFSAG